MGQSTTENCPVFVEGKVAEKEEQIHHETEAKKALQQIFPTDQSVQTEILVSVGLDGFNGVHYVRESQDVDDHDQHC